jgi:hypothetical protein
LILSLTVAGSGAAMAAASAVTPTSEGGTGRTVPVSLPKCGAQGSEVPCSWWGGVNVYTGFSDQFGPGQLGPRAREAIGTLAGSGANKYLVYVPELDTGHDGSVNIGSRAVSDEHLMEAADYGRTVGAAAVLKPHIAQPTAVADGSKFVSSYGAVLEHYGALATQMRAKVFVISTELTQVYRDPAAMNELIDAASSTYHVPGGLLAVAINWDQLHQALSFPWLNRLRLIGIDGYWPVGPTGGTTDVAAIESRWSSPAYQSDGNYQSPGEGVAALGAAGHEVVFTEIGYPQCHGATADPSGQPDPSQPTSCGRSADSPPEQLAATKAAYCYWTGWARQHDAPAWFHGLWWWDWDLSTDRNVWDLRGPGGGAADVIRSWNTGNGAGCPQRAS